VLISPAEVSTNVLAYANYNFDAYNVTAARMRCFGMVPERPARSRFT